MLFPRNGIDDSEDGRVAAPVSVEVRMRLALASSKEISANGAVDDRSVQPGKLHSAPPACTFCSELMTETGEDILLVLIGDIRTFGAKQLAEESAIVTVTLELECGKV